MPDNNKILIMINKILGWIFIIGIIGVVATFINSISFQWYVKELFISSIGCMAGSAFTAFIINIQPEIE